MASKFSDEIFEALKAVAPLDLEKVTKVADHFGEKPKALTAAAIRAGIPYERKARVSKSGDPVTTKEDLVKSIATSTGLEVTALEGLDKATKTALVALVGALS